MTHRIGSDRDRSDLEDLLQIRTVSQCGRCRAAITLYGDLSPCVIGRFLVAGTVKDEPLGDILGGARWDEIVGSIPAQGVCTPADSNDCDPSRKASGLDVAR
jgi:hypothetical protein